jgi:hypothetical protein
MSTDSKSKSGNVIRLGKPQTAAPDTTPEKLAEMVGTVEEPTSARPVSSLASLAAGVPKRASGGFKFKKGDNADAKPNAVVEPLPSGRSR